MGVEGWFRPGEGSSRGIEEAGFRHTFRQRWRQFLSIRHGVENGKKIPRVWAIAGGWGEEFTGRRRTIKPRRKTGIQTSQNGDWEAFTRNGATAEFREKGLKSPMFSVLPSNPLSILLRSQAATFRSVFA
jgi:hypothetical protein